MFDKMFFSFFLCFLFVRRTFVILALNYFSGPFEDVKALIGELIIWTQKKSQNLNF